MQKNTPVCAHCGKKFVPLEPQIPLISRSDGLLFHVFLFAGPDPRVRVSGGFFEDQVVCYFRYTHVNLGPADSSVCVFIIEVDEDPEEAFCQLGDAADKLAELVARGERLTAVYTLYGWNFRPGFPV